MHGDNDRRIGRIRILKRLLSLTTFHFFFDSLIQRHILPV